ncbi:type I restriction-modification system subunit M [Methanoculleus sp. YWC-01]|jgi:type I restriction enzyme M protein|uniref:site-specific DNA-methyltransferase (adenine-specific) n=1 Tax=Methanoculleus nereidis TaxID=2735141 RepID=A0ABU3Z4J5_9EURY|nr:type I restriction-modification system subunit M [Methanoculleus sp. YWC-01]MDV4343495.1 type I restriction-modification system subunit M [Methanoculleus sp. YWC-01]PKL55289.1 MAG: type I restriction-modification system subunit M [Methanomicrobiales archaeon HGW-Methanomicrobiales-6]
MAIKKSELYSSLWNSCDELRGGMDASQYKDYILTLLFVKYVSDKYAGKEDAIIEVPEGGSFADMVRLKGDKEIGDKINKIIGRLAEANGLKGVIDQADFNDEAKLGSGKEMQDRLSKLVAIFDGLDLRANRAEGDDLLGDAYEYLMRHFATESGKSKGQFYTPAEVSRVIAKVIGIGPETRQDQTIYDPACGSGSLLLKASDEAPRGISIYGQEMDNATWALSRMNMILHGHPGAEIWRGNTLADPHFKNPDGSLKKFDFAVANPPFSSKAWTNGLNPENDEFKRFEYGVPPAKNGDYAFLLHLITSLKSTGKGAIILPHGVLFRGNKEADIRRNLVRHGLIKGIIGLPPNLFYGTGIPACIIVVDKENASSRTGIFMIDASRGFEKDGNKNRLRSQDIRKIVDVFNNRIELPRYSRMVPIAEIASSANDYNLNIPRYIDSSEPEDLHDLDAHLSGGIPVRDIDALERYWSVFPTLRDALFRSNGRAGYLEPKVEPAQVKATILAHAEFAAYAARVAAVFDEWRAAHEPRLWALDAGAKPREVVRALSEDMLVRFAGLPLLDKYDAYQCLMDYWAGGMQDDVDLVAAEGWVAAAKPRGIIEDKEKKIKETPDLVISRRKYKMDLIPPALIVGRYFAAEQAEICCLESDVARATEQKEEFEEEHGGEEGALNGLEDEKGTKIAKGNVQKRAMELKDTILKAYSEGTLEHKQAKTIKKTSFGLGYWNKEIADEEGLFEELNVLYDYLQILNEESAKKKTLKEAVDRFQNNILVKYSELTKNEIKALVVEDKWFSSLQAAVESEVQRLTQRLAGRVKELDERYARPLPELEREVEAFSKKIEEHLKRMGLKW